MRQLLIVGAGGFARETAEVVRAINAKNPIWDLLGFLDDDPALHGTEVAGLPVMGPTPAVADFPPARVVVCTGHPGNYFSRRRIVDGLGLSLERYATLIHPSADVPASCELGRGTVVLAQVVATTEVRVGAHVAVMPGVVLTHDDIVDDYVTLGSGVRLGGRVHVGEGAYVGAGALVRQDLSIGPWALVGMGAVVTRNVPGGQVWAGVPARYLRHVEVPEDLLPPLSNSREQR